MLWGSGARVLNGKLLLHGSRGTLNLGTHKTVLYQDVLSLYWGVLSLFRLYYRLVAGLCLGTAEADRGMTGSYCFMAPEVLFTPKPIQLFCTKFVPGRFKFVP